MKPFKSILPLAAFVVLNITNNSLAISILIENKTRTDKTVTLQAFDANGTSVADSQTVIVSAQGEGFIPVPYNSATFNVTANGTSLDSVKVQLPQKFVINESKVKGSTVVTITSEYGKT